MDFIASVAAADVSRPVSVKVYLSAPRPQTGKGAICASAGGHPALRNNGASREYPDTMPQATKLIDAEGRSCVYVPIMQDGKVVESRGYLFDPEDDDGR